MDKTSDEVTKLGKILWDYQKLNVELRPAEVVIAMGCEDVRVAERAAQLYRDGYCKWIVCTGRSGQRTKATLEAKGYPSEAEYFAAVIHQAGVPTDCILKEDRATHSVENIAYTKELLAERSIDAGHIIIVTAPYAERRQQATYDLQWSRQSLQITSPQVTFETYPTSELSREYLINALVGRVQRMKVYGERGFQAKTAIPNRVWNACQRLLELGYTDQLVATKDSNPSNR